MALAEAATKLGASVTLICGPSSIESSDAINRIEVITAQQMFDAVIKVEAEQDVLILSAAVADYRPKQSATTKIKKKDTSLIIELEPTPDILATLGSIKKPHQTLVGFALETDNELENAADKLKRKNCDLLILNSLNDEGAGFGHDTNQVTILDRHNNISTFELKSKAEVAIDILQAIKDYK